ncbi:chloroplast oxygen-evolving complex/thylakoid lumenal 25.6kDa protein, partial [Haematococcus lacustris]
MRTISSRASTPTAIAKVTRPAAARCARVCAGSAVANDVANAEPVSRRQLLELASLTALAIAQPVQPALAAKAPKGFNPFEDLNDGYKFLYPFGWQEVAVTGADVVFKDIVEPLESVSVTLTKTEKQDITEFGEIDEVAEALARNVLTTPSQEVKLIATNKRELNGRNYYEFEFTAATPRYTRHQLAVVAAANGEGPADPAHTLDLTILAGWAT